jgi:hypothetical protein
MLRRTTARSRPRRAPAHYAPPQLVELMGKAYRTPHAGSTRDQSFPAEVARQGGVDPAATLFEPGDRPDPPLTWVEALAEKRI